MTAPPAYPRTVVELLARMRSAGYHEDERIAVLRAYELAVSLFSARFQPSGVPFLGHLVRTAGILAADALPARVVAAALLHVAYGRGDFGDGARGPSPSRRRAVAAVVGEAVEATVLRYRSLRWTPETIPALARSLAVLEAAEREAVAMKLANELEHALDGEILYYGGSERLRFAEHAAGMAAMAEELGAAGLARELRRVHREGVPELPPEIRALLARPRSPAVVGAGVESMVVAPPSYRRRWRVAAAERLRSLARGVRPRSWLRRLRGPQRASSSGGATAAPTSGRNASPAV